MAEIEYLEIEKNGLDFIEPLWHKLNEHHRMRSSHFKGHFNRMTWGKRKSDLLDKSQNGGLLINVAKESNTLIGYCVSTISGDNVGEIESIFIVEQYRRRGIGDYFMKRALEWMEKNAVIRKKVAVVAGNEEAFGFYERYGFYPKASILVRVGQEP